MSAILITFYFLAAITLATAFLTIYSRNPIHSAIYLVLCFFSIAGHYLLFNAQFLAIVHIIVYSDIFSTMLFFDCWTLFAFQRTVLGYSSYYSIFGCDYGTFPFYDHVDEFE